MHSSRSFVWRDATWDLIRTLHPRHTHQSRMASSPRLSRGPLPRRQTSAKFRLSSPERSAPAVPSSRARTCVRASRTSSTSSTSRTMPRSCLLPGAISGNSPTQGEGVRPHPRGVVRRDAALLHATIDVESRMAMHPVRDRRSDGRRSRMQTEIPVPRLFHGQRFVRRHVLLFGRSAQGIEVNEDELAKGTLSTKRKMLSSFTRFAKRQKVE